MLDLSNARFAFLDLETTGLSPWFGDRVCEVGIVVTEGRRIKGAYQTFVNPEQPLSPGAASVSGLSDADLQSAPIFAEVANDVEEQLRDAVVVCHNAKFDLQFLDSEYHRLEREIQIPNLIDTLLLARQYFDLPSYGLPALEQAFHVSPASGRGAQADALSTRGRSEEHTSELQSPTNLVC